MKPGQHILSAVELRLPEAIWVLTAHAYATLVPLALCVAVNYHWDYLVLNTYKPFLFYVAAGLLCAGSAFEVAQNAFDRWYLTDETASANGTSFCDFLFYWLITAGQAVSAIAIAGDVWWVVAISIATVLVFPFCYLRQVAHFAPLSIANFLVVGLAFHAFGDPIVLLQIPLAGVTIYFFTALLKTGAQMIHGLTTVTASSGIWFFIWALGNGAAGTPVSWALIVSIVVAATVTGIVIWPDLTELPASPRVTREESGGRHPTEQLPETI